MKRLDRRTILEIFIVLAGAALFISGAAGLADSFWSGMGAALLAVGILRLIQIARYRNDEEYREQADITAGDERTKFITSKAKSAAFYICVLAEAIAVIVLRLLDYPEYSTVTGLLICAQLIIYYVSYLVLRNRY